MVESVPSTSLPVGERTLVDRIRAGGPALVALSGGVDSALVASLAFEALGRAAVAVTLTGPAVSQAETERAGKVARTIGIEHHVVSANPLENAEYPREPERPVLLLPLRRDPSPPRVRRCPGDPPVPGRSPRGRPSG